MRYQIIGDAFSYLYVELNYGEKIVAEPSSFVYGIGEFEVNTTSQGLFKGLLRSLFTGESFFLNEFTAKSEKVYLAFAPASIGKIIDLKLNGESWLLNDFSYLASYGNIDLGVKTTGILGLSTYNLTWLKVTGNGIVWLSSYGDLHKITIPEGQKLTLDNLHLVAFPEGVKYEVRKFGGLKSLLFSGEGIVIDF